MNDPEPNREQRVADLRRQWLAHAAAAFDLMFHPDHQADLVTFDQREGRAAESVDDLKSWLVQQHVAIDPAAAANQDQPVCCPHCGKPARRVERPERPLFERRLRGLAGEVTLKRAKWRCATCRVAFFPSGPETATGR
jgi:hypothetical protein